MKVAQDGYGLVTGYLQLEKYETQLLQIFNFLENRATIYNRIPCATQL